MNDQRIVICGPTASGKSALAIRLAQELSKRNLPAQNTVIINADSQQVYKEIPVLSAQPSEEEKRIVPHYLFGIINGDEEFNVAIWLEKVKAELKNHRSAIIVGGTGMYLQALFNGLSPIPEIPEEVREKVRSMSGQALTEALGEHGDGNPNRMRRNLEVKLATGKYIGEFHEMDNAHPFRPKDFNILNMNVSRETIYENIDRRFLTMLENGAIEEVGELLKLGYPPNSSVMKAVGVAEIKEYLESIKSRQPGASAGAAQKRAFAEQLIDVPRETMIGKAQQRSRNYAKRQMTWLRNQLPAHKIDVASFDEAIRLFI